MKNEKFKMLIEHEYWADQKIIDALEKSIHHEEAVKIFNHVLAAQHVWISRINGQDAEMAIWPILETPHWREIANAHHKAFLEILDSNENLERPIAYKNSAGKVFSNALSDILLHVMMHSQYHRGQVITLIKADLPQVPATDVIAYLRTTQHEI